jgi:hypothetical protein
MPAGLSADAVDADDLDGDGDRNGAGAIAPPPSMPFQFGVLELLGAGA